MKKNDAIDTIKGILGRTYSWDELRAVQLVMNSVKEQKSISPSKVIGVLQKTGPTAIGVLLSRVSRTNLDGANETVNKMVEAGILKSETKTHAMNGNAYQFISIK